MKTTVDADAPTVELKIRLPFLDDEENFLVNVLRYGDSRHVAESPLKQKNPILFLTGVTNSTFFSLIMLALMAAFTFFGPVSIFFNFILLKIDLTSFQTSMVWNVLCGDSRNFTRTARTIASDRSTSSLGGSIFGSG
jgi:hypothetical protein